MAAVAGMVDEAHRLGVDAIAAVGTAGLRIAANADEFIAAVQARSGVRVEVLPGEEEARLAYVAATAELGPNSGSRVVFDTGGGSSQFTFGDAGRIDERFSVDVGAVRFTERYGLAEAVSEGAVHIACGAIATELARIERRPGPDAVVGMGGAITNLAAVKHGLVDYDPDVVQGTVLDRAEIDRQIELYRTRTADERRTLAGLQPNRAEVILAGACIVRTVLDAARCRIPHGQRSRPAARSARRALREPVAGTCRGLGGRVTRAVRRLIPAVAWLPRYDRRWLRGDLAAGLAVTALMVPKNLGYAGIAGIPLQNGLYAAAAGAIIYAALLHVAADLHRPELVAGGRRGKRGAADRPRR